MYLDRVSALDSKTVLVAADALSREQWEAVLAPDGFRNDRSAWAGPSISSWSGWLADRWRRAFAAGVDGADRLPLTRDQTDRLWQRVIESSALGSKLIETRHLAVWARAARRSLMDSGESMQDSGRSFAYGAATTFLTWNREFDTLLETNGWIDPDSLLNRINRMPARAIGQDAVLLDPGWPWPEQSLLRTRWQEAGFRLTAVAPDDLDASVRAISLPDPIDEAVAAAGWAADQLACNGAARLAIVIPDLETRRHEIEAIFGDRLGSGAVSLWPGRRITDVGIFGAALRAIRMLSTNGELADVSRWLRSPFFHATDPARSRQAAELENRLRQEPGAQQGITASWRGHGLRALFERQLPTAARELDGCLDRLPRRATPTAWTLIWQACLRDLNWQGGRVPLPAEMHRAWDNAWARFAGLTPVSGPMDAPTACEAFERIASTEAIYQPMGLCGVHLLSRMEQIGPGFAGAWITGCTEDRLPGPSRPNPFVPWSLQCKHRMPGASPENELARSREAIARLRGRLPELIFSSPRCSEELVQTPSPLIHGWQPGPELRPSGFGPAQRLRARNWRESVSRAPPLDGNRIPGGTRTLDLQSSAPVTAFCIARLRAEPVRRPVRGVGPRLRGILVHRVLELLLGGGGTDTASVTAERTTNCLDRALAELVPAGDAGWSLQVATERARIEKLMARFLELEAARKGFTIAAVEQRGTATIGGWQLRYRIDRIDCMSTGEQLLIDYKTGESPGGRWFESRLAECQLPVYAVANDASGIATIQLGEPRIEYRGAGTDACALPGQFRLFADQDWRDQVRIWREQLEGLIAEFARGDVRVPGGARQFVASDARGHAGGAFAPLTRVGQRS